MNLAASVPIDDDDVGFEGLYSFVATLLWNAYYFFILYLWQSFTLVLNLIQSKKNITLTVIETFGWQLDVDKLYKLGSLLLLRLKQLHS